MFLISSSFQLLYSYHQDKCRTIKITNTIENTRCRHSAWAKPLLSGSNQPLRPGTISLNKTTMLPLTVGKGPRKSEGVSGSLLNSFSAQYAFRSAEKWIHSLPRMNDYLQQGTHCHTAVKLQWIKPFLVDTSNTHAQWYCGFSIKEEIDINNKGSVQNQAFQLSDPTRVSISSPKLAMTARVPKS